MIIRAIRAENFMKFSSLRLSGLPARGIVGVEGPNESGKTTVGEAVLFALFGKTRASLETSVSRLIRWGADYLSVEVEFHVPGRGDFLIYREIDKYGTNFVKVIDIATRAEVAAGNVNVSEFLARALKFDFFEFHHSFYHDQVQAGAPKDAHSGLVERMTGIAQIQDSLASFKKDIEQLEREFAHYQKDIQRNLQQMEKYDRNAAKLPELRELARLRNDELERARAEERRRQEESEAVKRLGEERLVVGRRLEQLAEEPAAAILPALREIQAGLAALQGGSPLEREFAERNRDELAAQAARLGAIEAALQDFQALLKAAREASEEVKARLDPRLERSLPGEEEKTQEERTLCLERARRAGLVSLVLFLVAVLAGGLAALLFLGPRLPPALSSLVSPLLSSRSGPVVKWSAAGAALLLLVLSVLFLVKRTRARRMARELDTLAEDLGRRLQDEMHERDKLAALLAKSGPGEVVRAIDAAGEVGDRRVSSLREAILRDHGPLVEQEGEGEYRKALLAAARQERELKSRAGKEAQRVERALQEAEGAVKKSRGDLDRVESEVHECEAQAAKKELLLVKNRELSTRSQEIRSAIDLKRMSIELLDDTASSMRNKIGPALSRYMKELLPRLTSGRYRDIKVGNDLTLQVFTSDKSDFLDPAELSGGTHEALALALRLATSQAFIASRTRQSQFVFLDEPFKMMDESRALETLEVLGQLSEEIQQIFLIQPNFTPAQRAQVDWLIEVSVNTVELNAVGPGRSPADFPRSQAAPPGAGRESAARRDTLGAPQDGKLRSDAAPAPADEKSS